MLSTAAVFRKYVSPTLVALVTEISELLSEVVYHRTLNIRSNCKTHLSLRLDLKVSLSLESSI